MDAITLNTDALRMNDTEFFDFCQDNKDIRLERDANGNIIIMAPTGIATEWSNTDLIVELGIWNKQHQLGEVLGNNGGFLLPNGAMRVPDAAWIRKETWQKFTKEEKSGFMRICPEFITEIRSKSHSLTRLKDKMQEWVDNGCQLGWLIDPIGKAVYIYQPGQQVVYLARLSHVLTGEETLPGFTFDMKTWKK